MFVPEVSNYIISRLDNVNKKKTKVDLFIKLIEQLCSDNSKNIEENMSVKYQTKGAKIMNSVLSGNLPNMFDIYNTGQLINIA